MTSDTEPFQMNEPETFHRTKLRDLSVGKTVYLHRPFYYPFIVVKFISPYLNIDDELSRMTPLYSPETHEVLFFSNDRLVWTKKESE